jgi:basic amino acid/polyamine antiporter, APA family
LGNGDQGALHTDELKRSIGLFQAITYGVGLILGAGIYVIIGDVAAIAGNAMWISFVLAALIAIVTGFSYAELSSIFPKSAAEYVYSKNAFDSNFVGSIAGCMIIFVAIVSAATVAIGFAEYLTVLAFSQVSPILIAIILMLVLSFINFYGISESIRVNTAFTFIELAGLVLIIVAGIWLSSPEKTDYFEIPGNVDLFKIPSNVIIGVLLSSTGLIFFAYYGFENIVNISEETKTPTRIIPLAVLFSIIITTVVYVIVAIAVTTLVGWEELSQSQAPLALVAERALGKNGDFIISVIALFATSNTCLMMLISGSRIIYGMSKTERKTGHDSLSRTSSTTSVFPRVLARVHGTRRTPWISIIVTMIIGIIVIIASGGSISKIANISVFGIFIVYVLVNLSLIVLRMRKPYLKGDFVSPISTKGNFPVLAAIGLATSILILMQFDYEVVISGLTVLTIIVILCLQLNRMHGKIKT